MRPTICFLTGTLNAFAGAERMTAVIANGLAERGYRVCVLSLYDSVSVFPLHETVTHHALFEERPSYKRAYLATVLGLRRFVRAHAVDVLVEVDPMLTLFTLPATLGLGIRRIAWEHCHFDEDLGRPARRVARWIAGWSAAAIVVLTERDREQWVRALHPRAPVMVIGNALPFGFPDTPSPREGRTVLAIGRLVPAKGFDILIRAWAHVAARHPGWRLSIVGEGEQRAALEGSIDAMNLAERVALPGSTPDVEAHYRNAAIFCLSSRYEGFGLVLLEAMAFGLPIVSTDCESGPRELIHDGVNGLQVPVDDPHALANALCRLVEDASLGGALGDHARNDARRHGIDAVIGDWIDLLRSAPLRE